MLDRTPQVFISYSWTSKEYQQSVIELASRLRHDGVDVKLDVWDLKEGQDKYVYMEQCVTNPAIDKVLILSDKTYTEKADQRKGGVGDETTIISAEVYGNADQQKFIPVVMERDENGQEYLPAYLRSRIFRDLSGAADYKEEYVALLRIIFDEPAHRRPEIGIRPTWLTEEVSDVIYSLQTKVQKIDAADSVKTKDSAARDFVDAYIEAMKQFFVKLIDNSTYLSNFSAMKDYRDVFLDHLKALASSPFLGATMADEFERLYNALYSIDTFEPGATSFRTDDFDLFRLHIWELFVCTVTYMLHFELYEDIHNLLVHTYFLRTNELDDQRQPFSYERLRFYSRMLEERIKPTLDRTLSNKYTLTGHYVFTQREYIPIYTGKAIASADLFLYQVYKGLELDSLTQFGPWFPQLYIYADEHDSIWKRLKSKRFCERIMPVFGVKTINDLKNKVSKCTYDKDYHYSGAWHAASAILTWIKLDEIAVLP